MSALGAVIAALAMTAPRPGNAATIDVSVATLWSSPTAPRAIDAAALRNPVDLNAWNRKLASTASRAGLGPLVVSQALYGERVTVVAVKGRWAKIVVPDQPTPLDRRGYPGWVPLRQLATGYALSGTSRVVVSKTAVLHLANRTLRLSYGTRLPVTGRGAYGNWRVRTPDGEGWIAAAAFRAPAAPTGSAIVAGAKQFVGLRYLWGGVSAWGFDCSGLAWDVFRAHGVTIPRDSGPQSRSGTRSSAGHLRAGDLVFYGSPATHVAIFAGAGKMIESPDSAHAVRVVPLRSGITSVRRYTRG